MTGIITKALSSFYYVNVDGSLYECKARGNFRKSGFSPLVGDRVEVELLDQSHGVVDKILEHAQNFIENGKVDYSEKINEFRRIGTETLDKILQELQEESDKN
jgi:ribosome biogenesis GTPase